MQKANPTHPETLFSGQLQSQPLFFGVVRYDRNAKAITTMTKNLFGKLFGDKGYISQALGDMLFGNGIQLITAVRRNMKSKALGNEEKLLLGKRSVIETVNDELKNICQVGHTRHRSISGFLLNIMAAIAAYSFFPKKSSIKKDFEEAQPKDHRSF